MKRPPLPPSWGVNPPPANGTPHYLLKANFRTPIRYLRPQVKGRHRSHQFTVTSPRSKSPTKGYPRQPLRSTKSPSTRGPKSRRPSRHPRSNQTKRAQFSVDSQRTSSTAEFINWFIAKSIVITDSTITTNSTTSAAKCTKLAARVWSQLRRGIVFCIDWRGRRI